eukprot:14276213-Ditylum_brightwellii.AAC.1
MSIFSSKQRLALSYLQHIVEQAYFRSNRGDKESGTICSRIRHFSRFCQSHNISDSCIPDKSQDERTFFMAMHASYLTMDHTLLAKSIKSNTIRLYLKAAALYCEPRRLVSPLVYCCDSKTAWIKAIISEQRILEAMSNRQEPLTLDMILFVCRVAAREDQDFLLAALVDWLIVGIYAGNRRREWVQEHKLTR